MKSYRNWKKGLLVTITLLLFSTIESLPIPRSATYVSREIKEHLSGLSYDITVFGGGTEKYNGEISIEFLLLKDGSIDDIRILRSDIESPEFQNELVTRVEKWRFCTASDDMIIVCNFDYRGNGD